MPHKHKRRRNDDSAFDLPPSLVAKPLPVRDAQQDNNNKKKNTQKNKKPTAAVKAKNALVDDTPKAFQRLMQYQTKGTRAPSGFDNGERRSSKKRKREATTESKDDSLTTSTTTTTTTTTSAAAKSESQPVPKILPGEKLSDFAARVDQAMPLSGMKKSSNPGSSDMPKIREARQTKHERHLRRLQRMWREEEAQILEREAAEREEREAEMEEQLDLWKEWEAEAAQGKAKKKGRASKKKKKGKTGSGNDAFSADDDVDPWAKLKNRDRANKANPFDVAQAPPQLTKPREIFKVRGGAKVDVANVPAAAGSLRRREELAGERRSIVEEYRRRMAEKKTVIISA